MECLSEPGPDTRIAPFNVAASDHFAVGTLYIRKMELGAHEKIVAKPLTVSGETFVAEHEHPRIYSQRT